MQVQSQVRTRSVILAVDTEVAGPAKKGANCKTRRPRQRVQEYVSGWHDLLADAVVVIIARASFAFAGAFIARHVEVGKGLASAPERWCNRPRVGSSEDRIAFVRFGTCNDILAWLKITIIVQLSHGPLARFLAIGKLNALCFSVLINGSTSHLIIEVKHVKNAAQLNDVRVEDIAHLNKELITKEPARQLLVGKDCPANHKPSRQQGVSDSP